MSNLYKSEVARFREHQASEEEAARLALSGFAITARHDFITARMELGGTRILQLIAEGKHAEAHALMNTENWGVAEDAITVAAGEGKNNDRGQSEPFANIGA